MLTLLCIWAVLLAGLLIFAIGRPGSGGALTLAYFLGLSLIHVPGVLPFLSSGSDLGDREETIVGFSMTILGLSAFVIGAVFARLTDRRRAAAVPASQYRRPQFLERVGWRAAALGAIAYFVLMPLSTKVPSATSLVSSFATLLVLGLWLVLQAAAVAGDWRRSVTVLMLLPVLPLATLVNGGFIGFGTYWALSVAAFLFCNTRRRIWFYLAAPPAVFLALSLFVTYMGQRAGIREVVWQEEAGLADRLDRITSIITKFEPLDLTSPAHEAALDGRLNQNWLVGAAIIQHEAGLYDFAYGATVPLWALIPRSLWPGKPEVGGGGDLVSEFTGISFAEDTSVGAGQVLEFYVNFGITGVTVGFLALGLLLMRLDRGIAVALATQDTHGFLFRAMPGLTLLQPGGNLLEITVAAIAALLAAKLIVSLKVVDITGDPAPQAMHPQCTE